MNHGNSKKKKAGEKQNRLMQQIGNVNFYIEQLAIVSIPSWPHSVKSKCINWLFITELLFTGQIHKIPRDVIDFWGISNFFVNDE